MAQALPNREDIETGARLLKLRVIGDATQEELAVAIGYLGAGNISRVENGQRHLPEAKRFLAVQFLAQLPDLARGRSARRFFRSLHKRCM